MFAEALEEARLLDRRFLETQQVKGPLHGVPVSFNDMCEQTFVAVEAKSIGLMGVFMTLLLCR